MKILTDKKIDQAVSLIYDMVESGHSFTYSKFIACKKYDISLNLSKAFQKSAMYIAIKNHHALRKRQEKRFVKEASC